MDREPKLPMEASLASSETWLCAAALDALCGGKEKR